MFLRLNHQWPHRFTQDSFWFTPLGIIRDALLLLDREQSLEAARYGDAVAPLTAAFCRANGAKKADILDFNPHRKFLEITDAKQKIPTVAAKTCLTLIEEGKVPPWAIAQLDSEMQAIKLAAL
ncbi:MAG: hypothetical protein AAGA67_07725 [Cyanobacteria bacterium P01_F01_bin.153]